MKQIKVILCIFLIAKSTFGMGLVSTFHSIAGSSCHSETTFEVLQIEDSNSDLLDNSEDRESEDKGCCEDGVCECVCCGHIFTTKTTAKTQVFYAESPVKHDHFFRNNYIYNGVNHIWQPPQNI